MKLRNTILVLFSILYLSPFLLGGWYVAFCGIAESCWGVENKPIGRIVVLFVFFVYFFIYYLLFKFILNHKKFK